MGIKLDNVLVLDNEFLIEYNQVANNITNLQESIYDLFDVSNKKEVLPFDENDIDYIHKRSYSKALEFDLLEYEEKLEKGEITNEKFNEISEWVKCLDQNEEQIAEINDSFSLNIQKLFSLVIKIKASINEKIIEGYMYSFKSNVDNIIMEKGLHIKVIGINGGVDFSEIIRSPYLYMFNTLAREAQRINEEYTNALLTKDLKERLMLLKDINFSDLNLLAKFEETIEKFDKNNGNFEALEHYTNLFKQNIEHMGNKISVSLVLSYKTQILRILNSIIDKILLIPEYGKNDILEREFLNHLLLIQNGLVNNIKLLSENKIGDDYLKFPDLTNLVRINNLRKRKLSQTIEEINNLDVSKLSQEEIGQARKDLDNIYKSGDAF